MKSESHQTSSLSVSCFHYMKVAVVIATVAAVRVVVVVVVAGTLPYHFYQDNLLYTDTVKNMCNKYNSGRYFKQRSCYARL